MCCKKSLAVNSQHPSRCALTHSPCCVHSRLTGFTEETWMSLICGVPSGWIILAHLWITVSHVVTMAASLLQGPGPRLQDHEYWIHSLWAVLHTFSWCPQVFFNSYYSLLHNRNYLLPGNLQLWEILSVKKVLLCCYRMSFQLGKDVIHLIMMWNISFTV